MVLTKRAPTSYGQRRLWFIDRLGANSSEYNIFRVVRLKGELDRKALEAAIRTIVERHESLRTRFEETDGDPAQVIDPAVNIEVPFEDLSALSSVEQEERVEAAQRAARRPFDLERGPMLRMSLLKLGEEDHLLLRTAHHIVWDAWSEDVFMRELATLYEAYREGRENPLSPLEVQYGNFALWQRRLLEEGSLDAGIRYWVEQLAGIPDYLELPADRPRPPLQTFEADTFQIVLSRELTASLKRKSAANQATLYMMMLAAFGVLLSRYSGQNDIVVGSPIANRRETQLEGLIGFFLNTLALRLRMNPEMTFRELLGQVRTMALGGYEHEEVPFERVVEELSPRRSRNRTPVFQVMFALQNASPGAAGLKGLTVEEVQGNELPARFDLEVHALDRDGTVTVTWLHNRGLFDRWRIEQMARHYVRLLNSAAANADQPIGKIKMLEPQDRHQVLRDWNATAVEYSRNNSFHELFEEQVRKTPQAVAVVFEDAVLSYGELNRRANQLARYLRGLGVGPDARVGICVERGLELMVGLLGILKAGGAYVPLDPAYPEERLQYMVTDSMPAVLLTQGHLHGLFTAGNPALPILDLSQAAPPWLEQPCGNLEAGLPTERLAYVIYTSGSTGAPKGVMIPNSALTNFLQHMQREPGIGPDDVVLATTTLSFDIAGLELYLPLTVGAQVRIMGQEHRLDGARLLRELQHGITILQATPTSWQLLLDAGWQGTEGLKALCGGEALSSDLSGKLMSRSFSAWNMYGPTETTVWSLAEKLEQTGTQVTIGRAIGNTRIYILDGQGEPTLVGVVGEIYIGGAGVARGYLQRPELTAERFLADPFVEQAGERIYRTGDLGKWLPDGRIEFVGRNDFQVKVRGFRIEMGEIEGRLAEHARVREAVVIAREDVAGDKRLVAYYTCTEANDAAIGAEELHRHLSTTLPDYMVPAAYMHLTSLPLTLNGKLDRKGLPAPEADAYVARVYEETVGEIETALAGIWAEILKVERVGRLDNFFELGGHSLLVARVIARLRKSLNIEVTIGDLFACPVLADLAFAIKSAAQVALPLIMPAKRGDYLLLSFAQQRLWFMAQMEEASRAYHISVGMRLTGQLDRLALRWALDQIVVRHESLRTTFISINGEPRQRILSAEEARFHLIEHDLGGQMDAAPALNRLIEQEAIAPFDLEQGPLVRGSLIRESEDRHVLLITTHHIVTDGWSIGIFIRELSLFYSAFHNRGQAPVKQLSIQYGDFAAWQREWLQGPILERQLSYWRCQLDGAPVLQLPSDRPRPAVASHRAGSIPVELSPELSEKLRVLSRREGVTLFMTLLAAYQVLLHRYSEQEDFIVGSPIANRNQIETEGLIGLFINQLAIRSRLQTDWTFKTLLGKVRETMLSAYAHQEAPFEKLVEELAPERTLSHSPLFQVVFALQNNPKEELRFEGVESHPLVIEQELVKSDLSLVLVERQGAIKGILGFAADLFDEATARRMAGRICTILQSVSDNCERKIADLCAPGPSETRQLLEEWNPSQRPGPAIDGVHTLFEKQAERAPHAVALVYEGQQRTYEDLNRCANQLGRYLQMMGVSPEVRVGICMERSLEMIVSVLGVLKTGGAYVALDPALPMDRLAGMLEDSHISILLTQRSLRDTLPNSWVHIISMDDEWEMIAQESGENLCSSFCGENLAYVIYTSGSTGKPKGVGIEHRHLASYVHAVIERTGMKGGWSYGLVSTFAADLGHTVLFPSLCVGGSLHVISQDRLLDGAELRKYMEKWGALDCLKITPTHLRTLVATGTEAVLPRKLLVLGGESSSWEWIKRWREGSPACEIWNHYGPTECTVGVCAYHASSVLADPSKTRGSVPLGRPLDHSCLYVLDDQWELSPIGVVGDLYISGAGVGRGYLGREDATADRFVPDPYSGESGSRMYRTGDRVRWREGGELEFLGRADGQVKLRGYRVELGEIEHLLNEYAGVRQSAVVVREDEPGEQRLVAYVVPSHGNGASSSGQFPTCVLPNGMSILQQNKNETEYLYREIFESQIYFRHGIELPEDACVFDVGANVGMFTLFAGERCPRGRIFSFEPISGIHECLKSNAGQFSNAAVKVLPIGLSNEEKSAEFTYYPRYSMMSSLSCYSNPEEELETIRQTLRNQQEAGDGTAGQLLANVEGLLDGRFTQKRETCILRRLSSVIREEGVERIDLLKVDVQRAELDVLRGIDSQDWDKIQQIVMEVHDQEGRNTAGRIQEIIGLLEEKGFVACAEQYDELRGTDRWNLFASRKQEQDRTGGLAPIARREAPPASGGLNCADLRQYLAGRLPEYMVPSAIVTMNELPLTGNGKLDRRALPAPKSPIGKQETGWARTPVEEIVSGIWSEVLKVGQVGIDDNFFDLGGHSLLATQVIARVQGIFGVELPVRLVFEQPTVNGMAQAIEGFRAQHTGQASAIPMERVIREGPLPLSFAQQRMWFLAQLEGVSRAYHIFYRWRLIGRLDRLALRRALDRIVARHEALRTKFAPVDGEPVQQIIPAEESSFHLVEHDLCGEMDAQEELDRLIEPEENAPFDLERGPLIRGMLVCLSENEHALQITIHHIVSDGWSMGVLMKELSVLYSAFARGEADPLPELGVQYGDYAVWQRKWIEGDILRGQAEYWQSTLSGAPTLLELPADHARPAEQDYAGGWIKQELDAGLIVRLRELSKKHEVTLYMTVLAAWAALLARLSGQQDIVIGTPVANRGRVEIEGLIGFFVNTLALRLDLSGAPTVGDLLGQVKRQSLMAQQHQDIPFERVVEIVRPVRSVAHSPLFQVMFDWWRNSHEASLLLPGLELRPLSSVSTVVSKFDLSLAIRESGERIMSGLEYATALFERLTVERYLGYLHALLDGMVSDSAQGIKSLPLLPQAERRQVLYEWNATEEEYPKEKSFQELFERQVSKTPEAVAAVCEDATLSYAELNRRANQLARYLRDLGVGPEGRVAICAERGLEWMVGMLAVWKAGGGYVPLDPAYPVERLRFMLEDSRPVVLLTQERFPGLFSGLEEGLTVVDLNAVAPAWSQQPETNLERERRGESWQDLAYVIYTSGSTGVPKGAMVEQRGMVNHLYAKVRDLRMGGEDVVGQTASQCFDISVWQFLSGLLVGGRVVIVGEKEAHDPEALLQVVESGGVTILETVPSMLEAMVGEGEGDESSVKLGSLRWVVVTGEACPIDLCRRWMSRHAEIAMLNAYGPTECSDDVTHHAIRQGPGAELRNMPIGRPVGNMQGYVLDGAGEPVPLGVSGELYIGGDGVGRGYWNRADLTAERFVADGFSGRGGGRLYRTGDVARWNRDQNLEFLGRMDHQVKVRGYRIELMEIEARLGEYLGIREAVVMAREDTAGDKRLVAYYTCGESGGGKIGAEELRTHLAARLPEYMVPGGYVWLEKLPLTANGKVDRKALPAPEADAYTLRRYQAPVGETETVLAGIWAEVLKVERVGRHDNFFELGGHSLLVVRVISRIRRILNLEVSIGGLFAQPILTTFAEHVINLQLEQFDPDKLADVLSVMHGFHG